MTFLRTISFHSASLIPVPLFTVMAAMIFGMSSSSFFKERAAIYLRLFLHEWLPEVDIMREEAFDPTSLGSKYLWIARCDDAAFPTEERGPPAFTRFL